MLAGVRMRPSGDSESDNLLVKSSSNTNPHPSQATLSVGSWEMGRYSGAPGDFYLQGNLENKRLS